MVAIPASLRRLVIQRAENGCEYCGLSQLGQAATFHIDRVIPMVAGGSTTSDNCLEFTGRRLILHHKLSRFPQLRCNESLYSAD